MTKLFAIEGLDGSGKETQAKLLKASLEKQGLVVETISFPRYGNKSAVFVQDYLDGRYGSDPDAVNAYGASCFFAMDRFVSYCQEWGELYRNCDVFIADRYVTSNAIHQCSKLPKDEWSAYCDWLMNYEFELLNLPKPSAVIYLRVDIETGQKLLAGRYCGDKSKRDVHERDIGYLKRSQEAAEWCCKRLGWIPIECVMGGELRTCSDIHTEILSKIGYGGESAIV